MYLLLDLINQKIRVTLAQISITGVYSIKMQLFVHGKILIIIYTKISYYNTKCKNNKIDIYTLFLFYFIIFKTLGMNEITAIYSRYLFLKKQRITLILREYLLIYKTAYWFDFDLNLLFSQENWRLSIKVTQTND